MRVAPYRTDGVPYDAYLEASINSARKLNSMTDDDFQVLLAGRRGSGKSTLAKHMLTIYLPPEKLNIEIMGLSRNEFANSLNKVQDEPLPRAICYDEANVNKRDSMSKWNKDLLDLYYSNRGLNIFHIWCNPSVDMIDKTFIEDCVKGIIVVQKTVFNLDKIPVFRYYYWYKSEALTEIFDKYKSIKISLLLDRKIREKYAYYRGWFKDYQGVLQKEYLEKKDTRMKLKTQDFFEKYGDNGWLRMKEIMKALGVSDATIIRNLNKLVLGEDYIVNAAGHHQFSKGSIEKLKVILNENRLKRYHKKSEVPV